MNSKLLVLKIYPGSKWLIDLKEGYCSEGWYLDKEACCWSNSTIISEAYCGNWVR